ncbi:HEXXH motif domain-containing protein [Actinoplanes couchii]|uniref:HEXXH motif domain-containing protein n=1 Tax=Actinoplanes couchii TaxID=403638 RepID=A0ABQ3WZZ1_9ACTN|nr:HEXXH motif domain-containing protein [Actinoplanes couchii]MDR6316231.1 HEXXH motif-containing protein [Actinoplanes couchii]GID51845.1 hypothetical protein Aco03nite_002490 [Actinoplanes couchii]
MLIRHTMPEDFLVRLARGDGGAALTFLINTQRSKNALLIRALRDTAVRLSHPRAASIDAAYGMLRRSPPAGAEVLAHPSVAHWAMHTLARMLLPDGGAASPGRLGLVALAAAIRGGTGADLVLPAGELHPRGLPLPSLGFLRLDAVDGDQRIRVDAPAGVLRVNGRVYPLAGAGIDSPDWLPADRLELGAGRWRWTLAVDDPHTLGPDAEPLIGPDRLPGWHKRIEAGWEHLVRYHPAGAVDVRAAIRTLFPLPPVESGHVSGTYRHASGCLAVSLPTDPQTTAATLLHELGHLKLSAVMDLFELVDMSADEVRYVPWRDDPRPLSGMLQGAYAHLVVAGFWRREGRRLGGEALIEYARWRMAAAEVCADLLESGRLTAVGRRFVTAMTGRLAGWAADRLPGGALAEATRLNADHRARWAGR